MLPNFFLIGANKAGTTSINGYLGAHPQIYMSPKKEPTYWSRTGEQDWDRLSPERLAADRAAYEALFDGVTDELAVGEASTAYLISARAPRRIASEIPDARAIAVLRDPSERAYSAYTMGVARNLEPLTDFGAAIDAELAGDTRRIYLALGYYGQGLARWFDHLGRSQVKVFLFEDLQSSPQDVMADMYEFLGVDPEFSPELAERRNVTMVPKSRSLLRFTKGSSATKNAVKRLVPAGARTRMKRRTTDWNRARPERMPPEQRARLIEIYADDIGHTEALIGRDLSAWKTV